MKKQMEINRDILDASLPPMPKAYEERAFHVLCQLTACKEEQIVKKKMSLTLAVVLILILSAGMALAYASVRLGLVDAFGQGRSPGDHKAPSEALLESIIPLDLSETLRDVKITLTEAVYDGDDFAIGYTCENLTPGTLSMVLCQSIEANGKRMENNSWGYRTVPYVLGGLDLPDAYKASRSMNPAIDFKLGHFREDPGSGDWQVTATFLIKRFPEKTIVVDTDTYLKESFGWAWDEEKDMLSSDTSFTAWGAEGEETIVPFDAAAAYAARLKQIKSSGIQVAEGDERDPELWRDRGYLVINSSGGYYGDDPKETFYSEYFEESHTLEAYEMMGLYIDEDAPHSPLEETGRVTLTFMFDSDLAKSRVEVYEPENLTFPMDVCLVRIRKVTLSPLKTSVAFDLEPLGDDWNHEAISSIFAAFGGFALADPNGNPLDGWGIASGDGGGGGAMPLNEEETRWVLRYEINGPGLYQKPEAIRIITTDMFSPADRRFQREGITEADIEAYLARKEIFDNAVLVPLP